MHIGFEKREDAGETLSPRVNGGRLNSLNLFMLDGLCIYVYEYELHVRVSGSLGSRS